MAHHKVVADSQFRQRVWRYYRTHGRHTLPWRRTCDPYKILVSEVMLQQTQVERVLPFYAEFMKRFPTARKLAAAPLSEVLRAWQGLGYNRRAKMLHLAAQQFPSFAPSAGIHELIHEFEQLPGVGPYTARAVAAFSFNKDVIFVETNIRTAVIHHFYSKKKQVSDKEIEIILQRALPRGRAREWYSALMDYGAALKKQGIRVNTRSKDYRKQSEFAGSSREARGTLLRTLVKGSRSYSDLLTLLGDTRKTQMSRAINELEKEQLIQKMRRNRYQLSS